MKVSNIKVLKGKEKGGETRNGRIKRREKKKGEVCERRRVKRLMQQIKGIYKGRGKNRGGK